MGSIHEKKSQAKNLMLRSFKGTHGREFHSLFLNFFASFFESLIDTKHWSLSSPSSLVVVCRWAVTSPGWSRIYFYQLLRIRKEMSTLQNPPWVSAVESLLSGAPSSFRGCGGREWLAVRLFVLVQIRTFIHSRYYDPDNNNHPASQ